MAGARLAGGTAAGLLVAFASNALAGPAVAIRYSEPQRWKNPQLTQEGCLTRAETVLVAAGFGKIERTEQTRYGTLREYTGAIRCILDKQIVMFIVSGPERQTSDDGSGVLFQRFEAAD
jgi:hypothetical protein